MKKMLSLGLCLALAAALLTGCTSNLPRGYTPFGPVQSPETAAPESQAPATQAPAPAGGSLNIGLAVASSAGSSKAPGDGADGLAQMDSAVVAVLVDENGVITDCKIDGVQTKVSFDATGKVLTPLDTLVPTKMELGTDYGMIVASSIGKEWNEQAAALAAYAVGKTVAELKGIALDEGGHAADAEVASFATYSIAEYLDVIEKAVSNAQPSGAQAGDRLGLGIRTNIEKSKDAAADAGGQAQAYSMYTATAFDASGRITACILDGSQTTVTFNGKGEITSDLADDFATKNELKDGYGMKGASGIGLEWYEQAANFAQYVIGKTAAEVSGVAVDEGGHATGADLTASVTISIGDFQEIINKAAEQAGPFGAAGGLNIGLAVVSSAGSSKAPGDGADGLAQMDSAVVAVLVDENGVITDCKIDGVQTKVSFDATGKVLTPLDTLVPTKMELGTDYGMIVASSIGKEWNEQAAALAAYAVGKTVAELKGIALDEGGHAADAEVASFATYSIAEYLDVIEKAVSNAQPSGAQAGDRLGLGIRTNIEKSKDAAADAGGQAQAYSMYTATAFDASGRITACILDGSQTTVTFNGKGEITSDLADDFATKNELKDGYGMKGASGIGLEWYEQAANFAQYVIGKTAAEVSGVAVDEGGHATGADLTASVTISIGDFQEIINKAAEQAGPFGAAGGLNIGLAVVSSAGSSKAPGDGADGLAQMDSAVVAVLVDENGVITDCKIDGVQTKVSFDATGKVLTPLDTLVPTKMELGKDYGMIVASSIGKEWNEQAAALAAYAVGKTVAELKGIALDEGGHAADAEVASFATYSIAEYLDVIEKAVSNARPSGAQAGDRLGLGIRTNIEKSKDAAADADGQAQAYSMYTATAFNSAGKITACILDGSQTTVTFNGKGEITSNLTEGFATKNELKDGYGMKGASGIGLEWYEQAANFAQYVIGKTAAEVSGVAVDEGGHATGADLTASVTISIGDFQEIIQKAAQSAS